MISGFYHQKFIRFRWLITGSLSTGDLTKFNKFFYLLKDKIHHL